MISKSRHVRVLIEFQLVWLNNCSERRETQIKCDKISPSPPEGRGGNGLEFESHRFERGSHTVFVESDEPEFDFSIGIQDVVSGVSHYADFACIGFALHQDRELESARFDVIIDDFLRITRIQCDELKALLFELGIDFLKVRKLLTATASSIEPKVDNRCLFAFDCSFQVE